MWDGCVFQNRSRCGVEALESEALESGAGRAARARCPVQLPAALREEGVSACKSGPDHGALLLGRCHLSIGESKACSPAWRE